MEYIQNPCIALAAYVAMCNKFNICIEWRSSDYCCKYCVTKYTAYAEEIKGALKHELLQVKDNAMYFRVVCYIEIYRISWSAYFETSQYI